VTAPHAAMPPAMKDPMVVDMVVAVQLLVAAERVREMLVFVLVDAIYAVKRKDGMKVLLRCNSQHSGPRRCDLPIVDLTTTIQGIA
jgi:hypothetical protein